MKIQNTKIQIKIPTYTLNIPSLGKMEKERIEELAKKHATEILSYKIGEMIKKSFLKKNKEKIEQLIKEKLKDKREAMWQNLKDYGSIR